MDWATGIQTFGISGLVQVAVLACAYYYIFLFFRGTRGAQVLVGLALCVVILIGLTNLFSLDVLGWILRRFTVVLGVAQFNFLTGAPGRLETPVRYGFVRTGCRRGRVFSCGLPRRPGKSRPCRARNAHPDGFSLPEN